MLLILNCLPEILQHLVYGIKASDNDFSGFVR